MKLFDYNEGCTRIVFLVGKYVIKIPNFKVCHQHFLQGCFANWSERRLYKNFKGAYGCEPDIIELIAPSYFCSIFGLVQIQARCVVLDRPLTEQELVTFNSICSGDIKQQNFGYYKNKLVCLDYP